MLKNALIGVCLSALAAGCASSPSNSARQPASAAVKTPVMGCVTSTGTRIPSKEGDCLPGHVWSGEQLKSTGQTDPGRALDQLDPSVSVSR